MKKMILTASLMSILAFAGSALAVDAHQHETKEVPVATEITTDQTQMGQMDVMANRMQEMRKKMEMEKDPAARKALMQERMVMMKDCMKMMEGHGMMGDKDMTMDDRMGKMEKRMVMMQEMMHGMMMQQEMKTK